MRPVYKNLFPTNLIITESNSLQVKMEDQKKIALLEEYVQTLERENFAKNSQTNLLYEQLDSIRQQNQILKTFIENTRQRWEAERQALTQQINLKQPQLIQSTRNYGDELRNSVDMNALKSVAEDMKKQLEERQIQISELVENKRELQTQIHNLREQLGDATSKITKSEEKLRNQLQIVKQLENQIFGLKNSRSESRVGISFAKLEVEKLVRQNNELIEKIRVLEKQKNNYYNELKMASPLRSRQLNHQTKSSQKRTPMAQTQTQSRGNEKSERWNLMEEKLRAIRNQNEQLKANLAIY